MESEEKTAPPNEEGDSPPGKEKTSLRARIYLKDEAEAQELADAAATTINPKTGKPFRRGGLSIWRKKPHGWAGEVDINAKGIGPYLKHLHYKAHAINAAAKAQADLKAVMEGKK
jgi:hypothetical protein